MASRRTNRNMKKTMKRSNRVRGGGKRSKKVNKTSSALYKYLVNIGNFTILLF